MIDEFSNHKDSRETWAEIYRKGGEPLLRQWSKSAFAQSRQWVEEEGLEFHHGLRLFQALTIVGAPDDEVIPFLQIIPFNFRPYLLHNPNCGLQLIEILWHGPYKLLDGSEISDSGAMNAFVHHYDLAMHVFRTRPDLVQKLSPFVYDLFCFAAAREDRQVS